MYNMADRIPRDPEFIRTRTRVSGGGCWIWERAKTPNGYGTTTREGARVPVGAHTLAYEIFVGPVPEGFQLDHLCFNRACVNPRHLDPVTPLENTRRKIAAGRCWNGRSVNDPCKKCGGSREGRYTRKEGRTFAWCVPCKASARKERQNS